MENPKILLIEDSSVTQETLKKVFTDLGCEVAAVTSSEEALEYLRRGGKPDVMVLDFKLPGLSGPKFFQEIVLNPQWQDIAVIPFTSIKTEKKEDPELVGQWTAAAEVMEKVIGRRTEPIISKGEQGEDVAKVPPELILRVGEVLLRKKKPLPSTFRQAMKLLIEAKNDQDTKARTE